MRKAVALGLLSALVAAVATIHLLPPIDDFSPENPFWNGLSAASERFQLVPVEDLRAAVNVSDARSSALLIVGASKPFAPEEVEAVRAFLSRGGLVVLADDFGTGNELLEGLGVAARLNGSMLVDPLFKERTGRFPKVPYVKGGVLSGEGELVLNYATVIVGSGFKPLAMSSFFSFLDLDGDSAWDEGEPRGPFVVAAEVPYGHGKLVVVSDPSFLINSMLDSGANAEFAEYLLDGREALLDVSHWTPSPFSVIKAAVTRALSVFSIPEVRYSLAALVVMLLSRLELKPAKAAPKRAEEVLKRHPDWDKDVLAKLEEDLAHGG